MAAGVTIHPGAVAGWGHRATSTADDLQPVPGLLADAVAAVEEAGGTALAGSWALTAVLAASAAATADVRGRMTSTASRLSATATTYAVTDATLAHDINAITPDGDSSWL